MIFRNLVLLKFQFHYKGFTKDLIARLKQENCTTLFDPKDSTIILILLETV